MASIGRVPLTALEKAKRKAARDYRKIAEVRSLTYDDIYSKRAGKKNMGRKPISKEEQVRRAKVAFLKSLSAHRAEALKEAIELPNIRDLLKEYRVYRVNDSAGRKGADRVIKLFKYIEKEAAKLDEYERNPCPMREYSGKGRKPMYKEEAIEYYNKKIANARSEIEELKKDMPKSQHIYYELREARLSVRRSKARAKGNPLSPEYFDSLEILNKKVSELEKAYKAQLKKEKSEELDTTSPSLASTSSNSSIFTDGTRFEKYQKPPSHEEIEELKAEEKELSEEIRLFEQLEEIIRAKLQLTKKRRKLREIIEAKEQEIFS